MDYCFACDKLILVPNPKQAWTADPQMQHVGANCFAKIKAGGTDGWQPPKGGPRLFATLELAKAYIARND